MSAKLLKRLLQDVTSDDNEELNNSIAQNNNDNKSKNSKGDKGKRINNNNKRRKNNSNTNGNVSSSPPVEHDEIVQRQIRGMLFLDQKMTTSNNDNETTATGTKNPIHASLSRITQRHKKESSIRKQASKLIVGNSRDASSSLKKTLKHEKTFNKKAYNKQKENKKLKAIARLLNQQKQQKQKAAKSKSSKK